MCVCVCVCVADRHDSLLGWTALLSRAPADAAVVPATQPVLALMGDCPAETLKNKVCWATWLTGNAAIRTSFTRTALPVFPRLL